MNWQTAFTELEILGVPIDPEYKKRVVQSEEASLAAKRQKKAEREAELREQLGYGQNEHFAFIVGYTSGGFPYGLTWDEWTDIEAADEFEEHFGDEDEGQDETDPAG